MAATRLIPLHVNKGKTIAQSLGDRTDYASNPEKTEKGELVSGYMCDPMTVDEEFLLSKRQYQQITGRESRHDVIAYQIRQSFKPGEITPEDANALGRELALRFTKGKYAFIVATHTDRAHIHNHIIFNSTSLDATRKFNNFWLSSIALQRISDLICLEHGLSVIKPKPYRDRQKRTEYPKRENLRDEICRDIDAVLQSACPNTFEELLQNYEAYRKAGYSKKFLEEHREEITLHKAAKQAFDTLELQKIPRIKELSKEYAEVLAEKKQLYHEYRKVKDEVQELLIAQKNVASLYDAERKEETQRQRQQEQSH